jgi:hypothetical protein
MAVMLATGVPQNEEAMAATTSSGGASVTSSSDGGLPPAPQPVVTPEVENMVSELVTRAYGTKLAQFRNPSNNDD